MSAPEGWEGILDAGEEIIWQGQPDSNFRLRPKEMFTVVFGLFFAGLALVWMLGAASAGGFFWMFGMLHFSVGLGIVGAPTIWAARKRRNTWYTLTDRRAIIATDMPIEGRQLKSYPITAATRVELVQKRLGTVRFAEEVRRGKNGKYTVPIGFEYIPDAAEVMAKIREIQTAHQAEKEAAS